MSTPLVHLRVPAISSVRVDTAGPRRYLAILALGAISNEGMSSAGPETDAYVVTRETT